MSWDWEIGVTGDVQTRSRLSPERQLEDMLRVEAAFARAMGDVGSVRAEVAEMAAKSIEAAVIDLERLQLDAQSDGMPVPGLVRQLKETIATELHPALHAGLTSQDVMDTALMLAVRDCLSVFEDRLNTLEERLGALILDVGHQPMMARTRMQVALPITLGHRIEGWRTPLRAHLAGLPELKAKLRVVQLGGPVGTGESFDAPFSHVRAAFADRLGLGDVPAWHTDRTRIMELGAWLARVTGSLGKTGHDILLMAQQGVDDARLTAGGRSSAMAHKINPVKAEVLVALSKDASAQLGALHLALDHEQERSGAAWTLEWLVLPRLLEGAGAALLRAAELFDDLSFPAAKHG